MDQIRDQRAIIDRRSLGEALDVIAAGSSDPAADPRVLAALKVALTAGRAEIELRFLADNDGNSAARAHSFLIDQLLRALYDYTTTRAYPLANPSVGEHLAVVAAGGYGRQELAPHSDVDLLFLLPYKMTPYCEQVVEFILYKLWDLSLRVGHAVRSIDESLRQARADMTVRTGLLESRYVWGEQSLHVELRRRFQRDIVAGTGIDFVEAKLAERNRRHERLGDSRYALEPNVKDGKGGLRDLHALYWIAKYLYRAGETADVVAQGVLSADEARTFDKAALFLWTVRCHLHYLTGRAEERLTFDLQPAVAARMGYTDRAGARGIERLMKHYFLTAKNVGDLTRIFCAAIEAQHRRKPFFRLPDIAFMRRDIEGFRVDGGRLAAPSPEFLADDPANLLRLFEVAQRHRLDIHPATLRWAAQARRLVDRPLRADPEANRLFLALLTSREDPEGALRRMNEARLLGRFIPDFGRVVAQMQYDMYHHYTVDEHTLRAIGILARIEKGELTDEAPIASDVVHKILSRRALYLALFLHDIAKGRGGDHSDLGAGIAQGLGPRLGFSAEETETTAWLVRRHLFMSNTAFKRDIDDPGTVEAFAGEVQSLERLRLLLVLTVADIRAVGPKTWNNWKATLLRELYRRTEERLSGGLIAEGREARGRAAADALRLALADFSPAELDAHMARGHAAYWLGFDTQAHVRHARLARRAEEAGEALAFETRIDRARAVTEVTVYTRDRPGLFARLAGAFAIAGANILDARIFTLNNAMALDTFSVQNDGGAPIEEPDRLARIAVAIKRVIAEDAMPRVERPRLPPAHASRLALAAVAPRVLIDNAASVGHTVVEVNGRDRKGLLYDLTAALAALNLQISSAKISTFGARAVDVFYVKDRFGLKIDAEVTLKAIRDRLMEALEQGGVPSDTGAHDGVAAIAS